MATLLTPLPTLAFPHEIDRLDIRTAEPTRIELRLTERTILRATLHPSPDGSLALTDLAPLLRTHLSAPAAPLALLLDGVPAASLTLLSCRCETTLTATALTAKHFLTTAPTRRTTHPDALELLHWRSATAEAPTITARWLAPDGSLQTSTLHPTAATDLATGITTADISPALLPAPSPHHRLAAYTVTVGPRRIDLLLPPPAMAAAAPVDVDFIGAFGLRETFHFLGTAETARRPTYTHARIDSRLRTLHVEHEDTLRLLTGPLTPHTLPLLDDLLAARTISRRSDGLPLVIEEVDFTHTDPSPKVQSAAVTFRTARTTPLFNPDPAGRAGRIFDATFDASFA